MRGCGWLAQKSLRRNQLSCWIEGVREAVVERLTLGSTSVERLRHFKNLLRAGHIRYVKCGCSALGVGGECCQGG
jgi:hypothetical protein